MMNIGAEGSFDVTSKTDALYNHFKVDIIKFESKMNETKNNDVLFHLNFEDKRVNNNKPKYAKNFSVNDVNAIKKQAGLPKINNKKFVEILLYCLSKNNNKYNITYNIVNFNDGHFLNINIEYQTDFFEVTIQVKVPAKPNNNSYVKSPVNNNNMDAIKNELMTTKLLLNQSQQNQVLIMNQLNALKTNEVSLINEIKKINTTLDENVEMLERLTGQINILTGVPVLRIKKCQQKSITIDIKYVNQNIDQDRYGPYKINVTYAKINRDINTTFGVDDFKADWHIKYFNFNPNKLIQTRTINDINTEQMYAIKCNISNKYGQSNWSNVAVSVKQFKWSNNIVHNYSTYNLKGWTRGYYKPYFHKTTSNELYSICHNSDNIIIFVGAIHKDNPNNIILGAFGPSEILHKFTDSTKLAYIPSKFKQSRYTVYWYHYDNRSFGFSKESKIYLNDSDKCNDSGDFRLCWNVTGNWGAYRIGNIKDLHKNSDFYKVIYYKRVNTNTLNDKLHQ